MNSNYIQVLDELDERLPSRVCMKYNTGRNTIDLVWDNNNQMILTLDITPRINGTFEIKFMDIGRNKWESVDSLVNYIDTLYRIAVL